MARKNQIIWKVACSVMAAVLALCIAVQINDADGRMWAVVYGAPFVFTLLALWNRYTLVTLPAALVYFGIAAWVTPGWDVETLLLLREPKMVNHDVELAREAVGMVICAVWFAVLFVAWRSNRPTRTAN